MIDLETLRHSTTHILASAVQKLYPKVKLGIGPAIENGFYYDFDIKEPFTPEILKNITKEMKNIVKQKQEFTQEFITKKEAKKIFQKQPYKLELINDIADEKVSIFKTGNFIDLCIGPHIETTKEAKNFKLLKIAGAYWKGDSKNQQLQRIYGTVFPTKEKLKDYLHKLEEALKRDHRKLGKDLDLFSFHKEGPGFPFIHPNGMIIWNELIKFWEEEHKKENYQIIKTPIILSKELWLQSGHWDHYKENMYTTKIDNEEYSIKPMNCPGGMLIYKTRLHSYREFPLKMGEIGLVHRHELSGALNGLFRVRSFHQDDAHIFCTPDQIKKEVQEIIKLAEKIYKQFNLSFHLELSTKPEKAMGTDEEWEKAETILEEAIEELKIDFKLNPGDGAFYGPKIDFHLKDTLDRTWQCGTIQLDLQMPEKFDLNYEGQSGKERPIMLHRTIYGSLERFLGILIEHYAGKFPVWLSPIQIAIITVNDSHIEYAQKLAQQYKQFNIRVKIDNRSESISKKVRDNQKQKIPYILTIGEQEINSDEIAVRTRNNKITKYKKQEFLDKVITEIKDRINSLDAETK